MFDQLKPYYFQFNPIKKYTLTYLIVILSFLIGPTNCSHKSDNDYIQVKGLNNDEKNKILSFYQTLEKKNPFFDLINIELKAAEKQIIIEFSDKLAIAGFYIDKKGKYTMRFNSVEEFINENSLLEEFFHAYQANFYGDQQFTSTQKGLIYGAANIEFEARLFKSIIAIYQDRPISETPSQKGLLQFTMNVMGKDGKINSFLLNTLQHKQYIELVSHFQQHWKERNTKEGIKNLYDNPIDPDLGPDACLHFLKIFEKNNK